MIHVVMDEIDQQIVALLRDNARRSFQDIGGQVSLSAPAVKRRVDRLQSDGVIKAYAAVVDPAAMGWHTHAFVALYCEGRMSAGEVRAAVQSVATALRGIRGTSAAFAVAYGVLFLSIVLGPYLRGEGWAWWTLFAGSTTVLAIVLLLCLVTLPWTLNSNSSLAALPGTTMP